MPLAWFWVGALLGTSLAVRHVLEDYRASELRRLSALKREERDD